MRFSSSPSARSSRRSSAWASHRTSTSSTRAPRGTRRTSRVDVPTHDTASRDLAFVVSTSGVGGARKDVAHTHGSAFATRVQAEHWLDVGRGDAVWCTAESDVAAHDVEHRRRPVVTRRRDRPPGRCASTPTSGSTCSSGSGRASSASLRPSTACSPSTPSSSASGHRASDGSCRPATSSTRRSSLSSRSAGACRSRTATARPRRTSSSRISPTAR